jgi:hypothetical protein
MLDSQESIATAVASQATPTAVVHPQLRAMEIPQIEEPIAMKTPIKGSELPVQAEIVEAEAIKVEYPVVAATTIAGS